MAMVGFVFAALLAGIAPAAPTVGITRPAPRRPMTTAAPMNAPRRGMMLARLVVRPAFTRPRLTRRTTGFGHRHPAETDVSRTMTLIPTGHF